MFSEAGVNNASSDCLRGRTSTCSLAVIAAPLHRSNLANSAANQLKGLEGDDILSSGGARSEAAWAWISSRITSAMNRWEG
jgi:hypothetical protein